jgi:tetratricopeptide (TPR) repeat protein
MLYTGIKEIIVDILASMFNCAFSNEYYNYAINYCTQCLEIDNLNDRAYSNRAKAFEMIGNLIEAKADLEMVLKINPTD